MMGRDFHFDPHEGHFVLPAICSVPYEYQAENGQIISDQARGLGQAYLTPVQMLALVGSKPRAISTWSHPSDGRTCTIGWDGTCWQVAWLGRGLVVASSGPLTAGMRKPPDAVQNVVRVEPADYRRFVSRLRSVGFKPMAAMVPVE